MTIDPQPRPLTDDETQRRADDCAIVTRHLDLAIPLVHAFIRLWGDQPSDELDEVRAAVKSLAEEIE